MNSFHFPRTRVAALLCAIATAFAVLLIAHPGVGAAQRPQDRVRVLASFDLTAGQTPEAITLEPDGAADVSLAKASSAVRVALDGRVSPLGQLPRTGGCPLLGIPFGAGIARAVDGAVYLVNCTGNADTGVWRLLPGGGSTQIARLPAGSAPHGMAADDRTGVLYVADSLLGVIWTVPTSGGRPTVWASGPALERSSLFGANGVVVHDRAVWVSNTDQGTIVRIPILPDGTAGPTQTVATGLTDVGSFAVVGPHDTIIAALTVANEIVEIGCDGRPRVVLTAADGLSNPTDVAVRGHLLYVSNGAYFTHSDPNVLVALNPLN